MSERVQRIHPPAVEKHWPLVLWAETRCVLATLGMLARNEIAQPRANVGGVVSFSDGTVSEIYRETAMRQRRFDDLVLLAVRFRLRLIGLSRVWHFLFRVESLLNTLLFAAHRGFQTKLWLTDRDTGYYRGIYEWQSRADAVEYLETLRVVLAPWALTGTFAYEIVEGVSRTDYLSGCLEAGPDGDWWRPVNLTPSPHTVHG